MTQVAGRTAFITGGGSGVALGQAKIFAQAGCKVAIADIRQDHLDEAMAWFEGRGHDVMAVKLDITDRDAYARAADAVEAKLGPVELLFNTAGVSIFGPLQNATYDDWDWQLDVNLRGVINGIQTFVPRMIARGNGGHIVNTASMAGMQGGLGLSPYGASKFAVVSMSEGLNLQLKPHGIGVSVLCPSYVRTRIGESGRNRPERYGQSQPLDPASPAAAMVAAIAENIQAGLDPAFVAARVLAAIREDQLYVFTHQGMRAEVEGRFAAILAAMDTVPAP